MDNSSFKTGVTSHSQGPTATAGDPVTPLSSDRACSSRTDHQVTATSLQFIERDRSQNIIRNSGSKCTSDIVLRQIFKFLNPAEQARYRKVFNSYFKSSPEFYNSYDKLTMGEIKSLIRQTQARGVVPSQSRCPELVRYISALDKYATDTLRIIENLHGWRSGQLEKVFNIKGTNPHEKLRVVFSYLHDSAVEKGIEGVPPIKDWTMNTYLKLFDRLKIDDLYQVWRALPTGAVYLNREEIPKNIKANELEKLLLEWISSNIDERIELSLPEESTQYIIPKSVLNALGNHLISLSAKPTIFQGFASKTLEVVAVTECSSILMDLWAPNLRIIDLADSTVRSFSGLFAPQLESIDVVGCCIESFDCTSPNEVNILIDGCIISSFKGFYFPSLRELNIDESEIESFDSITSHKLRTKLLELGYDLPSTSTGLINTSK